MTQSTLEVGVGVYQSNEAHWLLLPNKLNASTAKCLLFLHGRSSTAAQISQYPYLFLHAQALADAGYVVMGIDAGAQSGTANAFANAWASDPCMTAMGNAKSYLLTTRGFAGSTRIGVMGWSLGSGQEFVYAQRNAGVVSGIISYAGAFSYGWLNTNNGLSVPYSYAAELDQSYAATKTTTTGSGTLNQVGSNLTIASGTGFPASGTGILYNQVPGTGLPNALKFTYTSGGGTTTLAGCTIVSGSLAWGTGTNFTGVATSGGWATNAATRDPLVIAQTPLSFDNIPIHCFLAADDPTVGRAQTPQASMVPDFVAAVNAVHANQANFHKVVGSLRAAGTTTVGASPPSLTTSGQNLPVASTALFSAGGGNAIIETGGAEDTVIIYGGISGSNLTNARLFAGTQALAQGQVIYPASLDGHTNLHKQIQPSDIPAYAAAFGW